MRYITKVITYDGEEHIDKVQAEHYLKQKYGSCLLKASHKIVAASLNGPAAVTEWLDENLGRFTELQKIKDDMKMEE